MGGIGWMIEDHLVEIVNLWRRHLARELPGVAEPALGYAAPVFLRELARALREDPAASANPFRRCELLLKVAPAEGLAGVVHEFRLLRRAIWEVLRAHGRLVPPQERTVADDKIDEALATAIGRLSERPQERAERLRGMTRAGAESRTEGRARTARAEGVGHATPMPSPVSQMSPLPVPAAAGPAPSDTARAPITRFDVSAEKRRNPPRPRSAPSWRPSRSATPPPLPDAADPTPEQ